MLVEPTNSPQRVLFAFSEAGCGALRQAHRTERSLPICHRLLLGPVFKSKTYKDFFSQRFSKSRDEMVLASVHSPLLVRELLRESSDLAAIEPEFNTRNFVFFVDNNINSHLLLFQFIATLVTPHQASNFNISIVALEKDLKEYSPNEVPNIPTKGLPDSLIHAFSELWVSYCSSDFKTWQNLLSVVQPVLPKIEQTSSNLLDNLPQQNYFGNAELNILKALVNGPRSLMSLLRELMPDGVEAPFDMWEWLALTVRLSGPPFSAISLDGPTDREPGELLHGLTARLPHQPATREKAAIEDYRKIYWGGAPPIQVPW